MAIVLKIRSPVDQAALDLRPAHQPELHAQDPQAHPHRVRLLGWV